MTSLYYEYEEKAGSVRSRRRLHEVVVVEDHCVVSIRDVAVVPSTSPEEAVRVDSTSSVRHPRPGVSSGYDTQVCRLSVSSINVVEVCRLKRCLPSVSTECVI